MINTFDSHVYSEETYPTTEREHDDVQALVASEPDDFAGYPDWSSELDPPPSTDNFTVRNGKVYHKPEPPSIGRINGFEL
jgi:hypothetical protein